MVSTKHAVKKTGQGTLAGALATAALASLAGLASAVAENPELLASVLPPTWWGVALQAGLTGAALAVVNHLSHR